MNERQCAHVTTGKLAAVLLAMMCGLSWGAQAKTPAPAPVQSDGVTWTKVGTIQGVTTNYTPLVVTGSNAIRVYMGDGTLHMGSGSWTKVPTMSTVIACNQVYDEGPDPYCIRTSSIVRGASGKYYGMLAVGNGYPTTDGYRPAWGTSDDGVNW